MRTITHATVVYQHIENGNIANQIHGKFTLKKDLKTYYALKTKCIF